MKIQVIFLLLSTIVICLATHGFCIGPITNSRCKCVKVLSRFIPPKRYQQINIFHQGSYCRKVEIVITLKNGKKVCINPEAQWVNRIISFLNKRAERSNEVITEESSTQ
ncbi:interleukin-8-like isoform X1 [Cetorhinus maximus]